MHRQARRAIGGMCRRILFSAVVFLFSAGEGEAFCDGARFAVGAGDAVVFPPASLHGIDVSGAGRMYCLEFMCAQNQNPSWRCLQSTNLPGAHVRASPSGCACMQT